MKTCEKCQTEKDFKEFPNRRGAKYCRFCREQMNKEQNKVRSSRARARTRERLGLVDELEKKIQDMTEGMDKIQGEVDRLKKLNSDYVYENSSLKVLLTDRD